MSYKTLGNTKANDAKKRKKKVPFCYQKGTFKVI
jgi:hypothetical protein